MKDRDGDFFIALKQMQYTRVKNINGGIYEKI